MTASKFLVSLLTDAGFQEHPCSEDLVHNSTEIFNAFLKHPKASGSALDWANTAMKRKYAKDIKDLANVKNGWHFEHTSTFNTGLMLNVLKLFPQAQLTVAST